MLKNVSDCQIVIQGYPFRVTPLGRVKTVTISGVSLYPVIFYCMLDPFASEKTVPVAGVSI